MGLARQLATSGGHNCVLVHTELNACVRVCGSCGYLCIQVDVACLTWAHHLISQPELPDDEHRHRHHHHHVHHLCCQHIRPPPLRRAIRTWFQQCSTRLAWTQANNNNNNNNSNIVRHTTRYRRRRTRRRRNRRCIGVLHRTEWPTGGPPPWETRCGSAPGRTGATWLWSFGRRPGHSQGKSGWSRPMGCGCR